ncbi:MAG: glycosyltransferase family 1 protein [Nitrospira sp.]|jgi:glycosyltransferase involved in cell wall biosynthesis|nr:glycosyltransferase family 1 protein [Nitrospira sp.]
MELAVNGLRLVGKRYGVGRYIEYLLSHWGAMSHPFSRIVVYTPEAIDLDLGKYPTIEHRIVPTRFSHGYWEQIVLAKLQRQHGLLFCPSYVAPILSRGKIVLTHLGSYEAMPSAFPLVERWKSRLLYQFSAQRADVIITVSESSKRDIASFYKIPPEKIRVIYLGVDPLFRPILDRDIIASTRERYFGPDRPYILFVGKLSARRNIPELVSAFAELKRTRGIPHGLLLVGPDSVGHNVSRLAKQYGVEKDVIHQAFASHEDLVNIYNAAGLFIYPSSYEGFGIPVLEAMACGVPTITLQNSSFLEFAAGTAYLAPDGSKDELVKAMDAVLGSADLQAKMRQDGPRRAQDFGWASIARQTMDVLSRVGKS